MKTTTIPEHAMPLDILEIAGLATWAWILCRNVFNLLAGLIYPLLCLCHPPTLRYTHAIRESKRERDIRFQHSADIFTRKESCEDWIEFYSLEGAQHSVEIQ